MIASDSCCALNVGSITVYSRKTEPRHYRQIWCPLILPQPPYIPDNMNKSILFACPHCIKWCRLEMIAWSMEIIEGRENESSEKKEHFSWQKRGGPYQTWRFLSCVCTYKLFFLAIKNVAFCAQDLLL